jgi:hypothetical protein
LWLHINIYYSIIIKKTSNTYIIIDFNIFRVFFVNNHAQLNLEYEAPPPPSHATPAMAPLPLSLGCSYSSAYRDV